MTNTKKTKDQLIAILLERGHHRPALSRMKRDDLANLAEHAESHDVLAAEGASEKAAKAPTGPVALPAEEAAAGDLWEGRRIAEVQAGPRWTYFRDEGGVWFLRVPTGQHATTSESGSPPTAS